MRQDRTARPENAARSDGDGTPCPPPSASPYGKLSPVPFAKVAVRDAFWKPRIQTNRTRTLPAVYQQCKATGRIDAWKLTWKPGDPNPPHIFWDSDVAKWLEAAACTLATHPDPELAARVDELVGWIEKAQQPDGYLNTHFTVVEPEKRWTNLRDNHELYCAGHLMEAAVALVEATGKRRLLDTLCRYADHIARTFGPKAGQRRGYSGHPEVELALVKLYRATGQKRDLDLASFFVDERGRQPHYFDIEARARDEDPDRHSSTRDPAGRYAYAQAHKPVREQTDAEGHSVRALYLFSGMADVAAETGDATLIAACRRLWKNVTRRRMYVTGGVGSTRQGERFTFDYDLPNETAYAETCANIALVFFAHRMLQLEADGEYADVMERALYNGVLSGVGLDGTGFLYANPLAVHPVFSGGQGDHVSVARKTWFGCACCPPNVARLLASFGRYVYSQTARDVYVHLYVAGRAELEMDGKTLALVQKTAYPWAGDVELGVEPESPMRFGLALRVPGWCRGAEVRVNGKPVAATRRRGYVRIRRVWRRGDRVALALPMPVERIEARPEVSSDCGKVALQRGPLVYCIEESDNGRHLADIALPRAAKLHARFDRRLLGGAVTISCKATRRQATGWADALYRPASAKRRPVDLKAVPYALWGNREAGEMLVWISARP